MWHHAEAFGLLDADGVVRVVSRNEEEAVIRNIIGVHIIDERVIESCKATAQRAFEAALRGQESVIEVGGIADDGHIVWSRTRLKPSGLPDTPVLIHSRRLPRHWSALSRREKDVIKALQTSEMNPKKAAKKLGITLNTFNAHRRAISQKCKLKGIGDFWIFVERCR